MSVSHEPLVSVRLMCYNQEAFISQAIESILAQRTTFDYEIVVGDDLSPDRTSEIAVEYQTRFPERVRVLHRDRKLGRLHNFVDTLKNCSGKYVALLDGDDYWTDPHKLQKQVEYLEAHPGCAMCFHPVFWLEQDTDQRRVSYFGAPGIKRYYTLDDLLEHSNFIPTASVVFRNRIITEIPDWFYQCPFGDLALHILNLFHSGDNKIGFIDEPMAVYRWHDGGVYGSARRFQNVERLLETYSIVGENLDLENRTSYRVGVSKWYVELSEAYQAERRFGHSILAVLRAIKMAPAQDKKRIFAATAARLVLSSTLVSAKMHRIAHLFRTSASILRNAGLGAFLCQAYNNLTGKKPD